MADETLIDKAIALIPGVGGPAKKRKPAKKRAGSSASTLATVQKQLAALVKHVEQLAGLVKSEGKKAPAKKAPAKRAAAKKPAARKAPAKRAAPAAKKPAARKPAAKRAAKKPVAEKASA
jgi:hypothetical protein